MAQLNYSFIIPVYNRPEEIRELLESMLALRYEKEFEVVIIEDGSSIPCRDVVEAYRTRLSISYYQKPNSGPGASRNFGMNRAKGNYFIILDSDVILPEDYLLEVDSYLTNSYYDCFGGPDAAHENFSPIQKAITYSMTSLFTTGGIRGNKKAVDKFQPRSFNMGLSRKAFEASGGFGNIHPGEDPDLSLRLEKLEFKTTLIPYAVVFHKRRIDWKKFYVQVYKFGLVRPVLNLWHPNAAKLTFWFPGLFIIGLLFAIVLLLMGVPYFFYFYLIYFLIIAVDAAVTYKSFNIGMLAVAAAGIQFFGYGLGFFKSLWKIRFLKMKPETAFPQLFFNDAKKE